MARSHFISRLRPPSDGVAGGQTGPLAENMLHIWAARKSKMTAIKLTPHHFVRTLFCRQLMQAAMIGRAAGRDVNAGGRSKLVARRPCLCKFISDTAIEEIVIASDSETTQTKPKPDKWGYLG